MEQEKQNCSAYSVPGSLQDMTLISTPLPQASSTATKRRSLELTDDSELMAMMEKCEQLDKELEQRMANPPLENQWLMATTSTPDMNKNQANTQRTSLLENAFKNMNEMQEKVAKELAKVKAAQERASTPKCPAAPCKQQPTTWATGFNMQHNVEAVPTLVNGKEKGKSNYMEQGSKDFEFLVPSLPIKSLGKIGLDLDKKPKKEVIKNKTDVTGKITSKDFYESAIQDMLGSKSNDFPQNLSNNVSKFMSPLEQREFENNRASVSSSADSSLGIISADVLEDMKDQSLADFSLQDKLDLSHRLAKQLSLDTSHVDERGLDISLLASARMKEVLAAKSEENKENKSSEQRLSTGSNYSTFHGYSSDGSKNSTAKHLSRLSHNTGDLELPQKESSLSAANKKPLREWNSAASRDSLLGNSTNSNGRLSQQWSEGRLSENVNPFEDYSKLSVGSEVFQSGEDVVERLRSDEELWRGEFGAETKHSLSGIYGDGDISIRTQGEKLSISSFLRSGSGPLGCLDTVSSDMQRPTFGRPVNSPEKRCKARAILPPPEEKLTFVVDDIPTKDTQDPWNVQSLREQFSVVHGNDDCDVSVPSLSYIGNLLTEMGDGLTPREMMDRLMAASRSKHETTKTNQQCEPSLIGLDDSALSTCGQQEKLKTIPSVVTGGKSFCRGYESDANTRYSSSFNSYLSLDEEPMSVRTRPTEAAAISIISIDDSVAPSICNVTDFEDGEEEYVCVLTPESMDFDIFNDYPRAQQYTITKACYVNGRRQDAAALVHVPVTKVILQPGQQRNLSVTVAALVGGVIKIKLDVTRVDQVTQQTETSSVFGKITAELPKIALVSPLAINMKPVIDSHITEFHGEYREVIELKNNGRSVVPIKLILTQGSCNHSDIFFFGQEKNKCVTKELKLQPGQTFKQTVCCQTPPIFEISKTTGTVPVTGRVDVCLATTAQVQLPPLASVTLNARLSPNFYCAPSHLLIPSDSSVSCKLYNSGPTSVCFRTTVTGDFMVQPSAFTIQPHQPVTLLVANPAGLYRNGTLTLHAVETNSRYNVNLRGSQSSASSSNSSLVTPRSSRATSPTSPCSSIVHQGGLQLACTHKELVWGGCALQQRAVRVCSLKNLNHHREKVLLKVTEPHNCFKILNEKKGLEREVKLSLQPQESRQISVVVLAGSTGPKWGHLTISRINSPQDKKVLPLYAFGGKAKVTVEGILQDPEQHMWLYLDSESLSSSFTLTNTGDYSAFVKISEGMSATTVGGGISITPPEQILLPGHSVLVEISLSVTPERLEYLLAQSSQTAISITRLTVTHGDESTRQRLGRVHHELADKLSLLGQLPSTPIPGLDKLVDSWGCAETLWLEDVSQYTIGVLVRRSALEALRLDTSLDFVDLGTTVIQ